MYINTHDSNNNNHLHSLNPQQQQQQQHEAHHYQSISLIDLSAHIEVPLLNTPLLDSNIHIPQSNHLDDPFETKPNPFETKPNPFETKPNHTPKNIPKESQGNIYKDIPLIKIIEPDNTSSPPLLIDDQANDIANALAKKKLMAIEYDNLRQNYKEMMLLNKKYPKTYYAKPELPLNKLLKNPEDNFHAASIGLINPKKNHKSCFGNGQRYIHSPMKRSKVIGFSHWDDTDIDIIGGSDSKHKVKDIIDNNDDDDDNDNDNDDKITESLEYMSFQCERDQLSMMRSQVQQQQQQQQQQHQQEQQQQQQLQHEKEQSSLIKTRNHDHQQYQDLHKHNHQHYHSLISRDVPSLKLMKMQYENKKDNSSTNHGISLDSIDDNTHTLGFGFSSSKLNNSNNTSVFKAQLQMKNSLRRKSCYCYECGGLSEFEKKTLHIVALNKRELMKLYEDDQTETTSCTRARQNEKQDSPNFLMRKSQEKGRTGIIPRQSQVLSHYAKKRTKSTSISDSNPNTTNHQQEDQESESKGLVPTSGATKITRNTNQKQQEEAKRNHSMIKDRKFFKTSFIKPANITTTTSISHNLSSPFSDRLFKSTAFFNRSSSTSLLKSQTWLSDKYHQQQRQFIKRNMTQITKKDLVVSNMLDSEKAINLKGEMASEMSNMKLIGFNVTPSPNASAMISPNASTIIDSNANAMIGPISSTMIGPNGSTMIDPNVNAMISSNTSAIIGPNANVMISSNASAMIGPNASAMIGPNVSAMIGLSASVMIDPNTSVMMIGPNANPMTGLNLNSASGPSTEAISNPNTDALPSPNTNPLTSPNTNDRESERGKEVGRAEVNGGGSGPNTDCLISPNTNAGSGPNTNPKSSPNTNISSGFAFDEIILQKTKPTPTPSPNPNPNPDECFASKIIEFFGPESSSKDHNKSEPNALKFYDFRITTKKKPNSLLISSNIGKEDLYTCKSRTDRSGPTNQSQGSNASEKGLLLEPTAGSFSPNKSVFARLFPGNKPKIKEIDTTNTNTATTTTNTTSAANILKTFSSRFLSFRNHQSILNKDNSSKEEFGLRSFKQYQHKEYISIDRNKDKKKDKQGDKAHIRSKSKEFMTIYNNNNNGGDNIQAWGSMYFPPTTRMNKTYKSKSGEFGFGIVLQGKLKGRQMIRGLSGKNSSTSSCSNSPKKIVLA